MKKYFVKVTPQENSKTLVELIGNIPSSPRTRNYSTHKFSTQLRQSKSISPRVTRIKNNSENPMHKKKLSHADDLKKYITELPLVLEKSQTLVKNAQRDRSEYDPKSFKIRLGDMIIRQRFNVGHQHVNTDEILKFHKDSRYFLNCNRNSEGNPKIPRSQSNVGIIPFVDHKLIGPEIKNNMNRLEKEKSHMEDMLKSAIKQTVELKKFFIAVKQGDIALVKIELDKNPGLIAERYALKQTALHIACKRNNIKMVEVLLGYNVDVNAKDIVRE